MSYAYPPASVPEHRWLGFRSRLASETYSGKKTWLSQLLFKVYVEEGGGCVIFWCVSTIVGLQTASCRIGDSRTPHKVELVRYVLQTVHFPLKFFQLQHVSFSRCARDFSCIATADSQGSFWSQNPRAPIHQGPRNVFFLASTRPTPLCDKITTLAFLLHAYLTLAFIITNTTHPSSTQDTSVVRPHTALSG